MQKKFLFGTHPRGLGVLYLKLLMAASVTAEEGDVEARRKLLPIFPARAQLLKAIKANACSVVVGETGSGKTTQLPQVDH